MTGKDKATDGTFLVWEERPGWFKGQEINEAIAKSRKDGIEEKEVVEVGHVGGDQDAHHENTSTKQQVQFGVQHI